MSVRNNLGVCMNAYDLYTAWEDSGAWQPMPDHFGDHVQTSVC
jgi:hypothetical protein